MLNSYTNVSSIGRRNVSYLEVESIINIQKSSSNGIGGKNNVLNKKRLNVDACRPNRFQRRICAPKIYYRLRITRIDTCTRPTEDDPRTHVYIRFHEICSFDEKHGA